MRLDRRRLVAAFGACSVAGLGPSLPNALLAAVPTDQRLVLLILRGALDGLAAVPAYADPDFAAVRGELAPAADVGMLDLDGRFGLHTALPTLAELYRRRELLIVHAIASPYRERSHFDGQDLLENGAARPGELANGWLARALTLAGAGERTLGLAATASVPLVLRGPAAVATLGAERFPAVGPGMLAQLVDLYRRDDRLGPALKLALRGRAMTEGRIDRKELVVAGREPGVEQLRALGRDVGRLLTEPRGIRVAAMDLGGFDTHVGQVGRLPQALAGLDASMAGLVEGLGSTWRQSAIVVVTEFGRTVRPNGSGGTDHGTASIAILAGGKLDGGRVIADWPGLADTALLEGRDLRPTTDLRALLSTVLVDHLGLPADGIARIVFPGSDERTRLRQLFLS